MSETASPYGLDGENDEDREMCRAYDTTLDGPQGQALPFKNYSMLSCA